MNVFVTTAGIYLGINVFGLIWSLGIVHFGLPDALRLQDRPHPMATLKERLPLVTMNVFILLALTAGAVVSLDSVFTTEPISGKLLTVQLLLVLCIDDVWFYGWHRLLHENTWMYSKIHRIHHKAFSPLPFEYIYVHPVEWMVGSIGPFLGFVTVNAVFGTVPTWTLWAYLLVRNLHELDIHSGMRSFLGPKIPFFGLAEHHDLHHAKPTKGNYASTFTLWDHVFRTLWRPTPSTGK